MECWSVFTMPTQVQKLRFEGRKWPVHGHTTSNRNWNTGLLGSKDWILSMASAVSEWRE